MLRRGRWRCGRVAADGMTTRDRGRRCHARGGARRSAGRPRPPWRADRHDGSGRGRWPRRWRSSTGGSPPSAGCGAPSLDRTAHAGHRPPRPDGHARLRRCPRPPGDLRPRPPALRPDRVRGACAAYLAVIAAYAASHPDEAWIRGSGWSMADFPGGIADRADLDRIVPDRPVYLETRDGHTAWVNSRGARARRDHGHDRRSARRTDRARRCGTRDRARSRRVPGCRSQDILPADTVEELVAGLRLAQAELHALGITNWQDAQVEPATDVAYTTLADRGELTRAGRRGARLGRDARRRADRGAGRAAGRDGVGRATRRRASSSSPTGSSRTSRAPCSSRTSTAMGGPPRTAATA